MPKDENEKNRDNKNLNNSKRQTSFGSESSDDSLLKKAKDVVKDVSTSKDTSTISSSDKKNSDDNYKAKRNANDNSKISSSVKKNDNSNKINTGNKGTDAAKKIMDKTQKMKLNIAKKVPGVGQIVEGAQLAKNTIDKIKQRRNNPNSDGSKVGKGPDDSKDDKKKPNNNEDNKNNESKENNKSNDLRGSFKLLGRLSFLQKIILFAIPAILVFVLIFTLLLMTAISSFTVEFISSMVRGEELTELFDFKSGSTNSDYEKQYIEKLEGIYKGKNNFNPDYISSTFAVMMDHGQYADSGKYGYSDIVPTLIDFDILGQKIIVTDDGKIRNLADIFSKQPAVTSNNSSSSSSSSGTGEVAGDAGVMVGSGNGLGADYVPNVIDTRVGLDNEMCRLTSETWDAFQKMEQGANAQGVTIGVNSCYRSYEEQATTTGNSPAAAGYSEHQLGSTIDIADRDGGYINNETVLNWLDEHAVEYGFVRSLTTMGNERHHYRYVGTKVAAAFKNYISNGGVNYLAFQATEEGKSIVGSSTSSSSSSSSSSSTSTSTSTSSSTSGSSGTGSAAKVVEIALAEEGQTEQAGGVTKYGQWYGEGMEAAEWCGIFVSWVANHAGVTEDIIPKSGLPSAYRQWFEEKGLYHSLASEPGYTPKPGDLAIYDRGHIGIVVEYNNGHIKTIDGNSGINTDRVAIKEGTIGEYPLDISGFASPSYSGSSVSNINSGGSGKVEFTDEVRKELKEFLKKELPKINDLDNSEDILDSLVDQIESRANDYYDFIGKKFDDDCSSSTGSGSCDYNIKGFYYDGGNHEQQLSISNLKVRLMDCSSRPVAIPGEELVDFEKYILGVVYAEIGEGAPAEAMKAQAIAARSYALSRPASMGNSGGTLLTQENGQWILQLRACTMDQVYCDPDRGCMKTGGENSLTKSGTDWGGNLYKNPLPSDDPLRSAVDETKGKLLVNNEGYVINAGYLNTDQNQWSSMANSGKNYTDILIEHYNNSRSYGAKSIESMSCGGSTTSSNPSCAAQNAANAASGPYANWKQCDEKWGGNSLGGSTICSIGCLATSMSMLIAKSGVPTTVTGEFNPGSFIETMKSVGGFSGGGDYNWSVTPSVVPSYQDIGYTDYSPSDVAAKLNQGYSGIIFVGKAGRSCHHWVAIDKVENGVVHILDPAGDNGPVDTTYPNKCGVHYFKLK